MIIVLVIECVALVLLFVCSAFFSSAETALFSLNSIQVYHVSKSNPSAGRRIELMLSAPAKLLSTLLIGNTLVNVTAAGLGFVIAEHFWPSYGIAVSIPAMSVLLLVFGETAPKRLAMSKPEKMAIAYSSLLIWLIAVMAPIRALLELASALFSAEFSFEKTPLTEDEFLTAVEVGEEEGVLDEEEREMVDGIIRLEETQASDVMTPRVDLVGIDLDDPVEKSEAVASRVNFRYLPVYRETLDNAQGFLDVPAFLLSGKKDLGSQVIPPFFVPETAPLDSLLATFQREGRRVAYVVDEYGGTAGLITRGDILEEIVQDVDNEYGDKKASLVKIGDGRWLVDGNTNLEDINYEMETDLDAEGADRIAGWVITQAEHIPKAGEIVEAQGCRATVRKVRKNRITLVMLERIVLNAQEEVES